MKRFILLACAALLCLSGCASQTEPPENPCRLKVHVQENTNSGHKWEFHYTYNDQGHLAGIQEYTNGEPGVLWTYEYDDWGNILRETTEETDGTVCVTEHTLTLDDAHRVLYDETFSGGVLTAITEAAYDKDGNQTMLNINRIGSLDGADLVSYVDCTYDSKGNLIQETVRWSNDAASGGISTYIYQNDRLVRMEYRSHDGTLNYFNKYSYDETGLIRTAMQYEADKTLSGKTITTFDEYGNELRSETYRYQEGIPGGDDDAVDRITTYTYESIDPAN